MDNSKPSATGGPRKESGDIKSKDESSNDTSQKDDVNIKTFTDYARYMIRRLKKQNFAEHVRQIFKTDNATVSKLVTELSTVEEKIKELFDKVLRKVLNFISKDINHLETLTQEDKKNLKKKLLQYKSLMEKIWEEHVMNVDIVRKKLETGIISRGEIELFVSQFDKKMLEVMKKTDLILKSLEQKELDEFKKSLRQVIDTCSDEIENSNDSFIESLEKMAADSEKITSQTPSFSQIKLPNISKTFAPILGSNNVQSYNGKPSPLSSLKKKLPSFNIKEYINSETNRGRANAAKTTYLIVLIGFVYYKWRTYKS